MSTRVAVAQQRLNDLTATRAQLRQTRDALRAAADDANRDAANGTRTRQIHIGASNALVDVTTRLNEAKAVERQVVPPNPVAAPKAVLKARKIVPPTTASEVAVLIVSLTTSVLEGTGGFLVGFGPLKLPHHSAAYAFALGGVGVGLVGVPLIPRAIKPVRDLFRSIERKALRRADPKLDAWPWEGALPFWFGQIGDQTLDNAWNDVRNAGPAAIAQRPSKERAVRKAVQSFYASVGHLTSAIANLAFGNILALDARMAVTTCALAAASIVAAGLVAWSLYRKLASLYDGAPLAKLTTETYDLVSDKDTIRTASVERMKEAEDDHSILTVGPAFLAAAASIVGFGVGFASKRERADFNEFAQGSLFPAALNFALMSYHLAMLVQTMHDCVGYSNLVEAEFNRDASIVATARVARLSVATQRLAALQAQADLNTQQLDQAATAAGAAFDAANNECRQANREVNRAKRDLLAVQSNAFVRRATLQQPLPVVPAPAQP